MKTQSEKLFEDFLGAKELAFEKIAVQEFIATPDYLVTVGNSQIVFELKELTEDEKFNVVNDPEYPHIKSNSRTVGAHIRRRITDAKKQIQYGANQGVPSVLLIYNVIDRVFQAHGTEVTDFIAAMYGDFTLVLDRDTREVIDRFNGKNRMLQENKNTSFSALGHLCDRGGITTVTLFENIFAKVKLPFDQLPPCFEVQKIEVTE